MKKTTLALGLAAALATGVASAHEAGDFLLRVGGVFVSAHSSSTTQEGADVNLKVGDNAQFGLTATYMITDNVGVELLGATPFAHRISAVVPGSSLQLGDVVKLKQLPPSLYVQYYFLDKDAGSRPYVGVGYNYTRFFGAKALYSDALNTATQTGYISNLEVKKHSYAPVINAGIDIKLTDNLYFNTAMWYTYIETTAKFTTALGNHEVDVKLDPFVFFMGLGYNF